MSFSSSTTSTRVAIRLDYTRPCLAVRLTVLHPAGRLRSDSASAGRPARPARTGEGDAHVRRADTAARRRRSQDRRPGAPDLHPAPDLPGGGPNAAAGGADPRARPAAGPRLRE